MSHLFFDLLDRANALVTISVATTAAIDEALDGTYEKVDHGIEQMLADVEADFFKLFLDVHLFENTG